MILTERIARGVAAGSVTVAFRRWKTPRVEAGSTFRTVGGTVRVDAVDTVDATNLTDADARASGHDSVGELAATFRGAGADPVFRIALSWVGGDPREALAEDADLSAADLAAIDALLDRLDARIRWARPTLRRLADEPATTAATLVEGLDMPKDALKRRIRTLKEHGLTRSLRVGYELSPRGHAYLKATGR